MIALVWFFFMVLSMVLTSSQAFLTAPVSEYSHDLSTYNATGNPETEKRTLNDSLASLLSSSEEDDSTDKEKSYEDYEVISPLLEQNVNKDEPVYGILDLEEPDRKDERHRNRGKEMSDDTTESQSPLDPWSIVWYIGSFGGLVAFFLIVSCSEWCCRRGARPLSVPYTQRGEVINASGQQVVTESPPPPYHLFAPPPYDSVNYADLALDKPISNINNNNNNSSSNGNPEKLDIYVITLPISSYPQGQQQQTTLQQPRPPA